MKTNRLAKWGPAKPHGKCRADETWCSREIEERKRRGREREKRTEKGKEKGRRRAGQANKRSPSYSPSPCQSRRVLARGGQEQLLQSPNLPNLHDRNSKLWNPDIRTPPREEQVTKRVIRTCVHGGDVYRGVRT